MPKENKTPTWKELLNVRVVVSVVVAVLTLTTAHQCGRKKRLEASLFALKQNHAALTDSLEVTKDKYGYVKAERNAFIARNKELRDINLRLYNELDKEKKNILSLSRAIIVLKQDTAELKEYIRYLEDPEPLPPIQLNDSTYRIPWRFNYVYDSLNSDLFVGQTDVSFHPLRNKVEVAHLGTELVKRETQIELVWGQKIEDDKLRVFVKSSYPGFNVESLSGVLIDPNSSGLRDLMQPKRWFNGWSIGIHVTPGFDLVHGGWGMTVGPSFGYNIYNF